MFEPFKRIIPEYASRHLRNKKRRRFLGVTLLILVVVMLVITFWGSPQRFPANYILQIRPGIGLNELAVELKDSGLIKSTFWFKSLLVLEGGVKGAIAGDYRFTEPVSVFSLAHRIASGDYKLDPIKVTIPEGFNNREVANLLAKYFPNFNKSRFVSWASDKEGYLFPDTYFLLPNLSETQIIEILENNFNEKIKELEDKAVASKRSLKDIVTMASILEEEARTMDTRRRIAGILWKRLDEGMLLQVDAVFAYIKNESVPKVYLDDLKIDSPYNTYLYKGLPPTPISNPGLRAIEAAITPIESKYYFYLTDRNGVMHYAVTHEGHVANKEKYLR